MTDPWLSLNAYGPNPDQHRRWVALTTDGWSLRDLLRDGYRAEQAIDAAWRDVPPDDAVPAYV